MAKIINSSYLNNTIKNDIIKESEDKRFYNKNGDILFPIFISLLITVILSLTIFLIGYHYENNHNSNDSIYTTQDNNKNYV